MAFLRTVARSFYSASLYRAARQEPGHRLGYSFLLVGMCMGIVTLTLIYQLYSRVLTAPEGAPSPLELAVYQLAGQWPAMTYHDGKLVTRDAAPTVITLTWNDGRDSVALATIDTAGTAPHNPAATRFFITDTQVFMTTDTKIEKFTIREIMGNSDQTLVITPSLMRDLADGFMDAVARYLVAFLMLLGTVVWALLSAGFFVARLVLLAGLSVAGAMVARLLNVKLDFAALMRLAALSFTPVALLDTLRFVLSLQSGGPLLLFGLGLITLTAALVVKRDDAGRTG